MSATPTRRTYRSPSRQQAATATRDAIAAAARELFRSDGFRATTIRALAERAGVAPQTVYAVFGTKRGVLVDLVRRAKESASVGATFEKLMAEPDAYRQLALTVAITVRWAEESADLVDLVRAEGGSDEDVAAVWRDIEDTRWNGNHAFVQTLAQRGLLREGLDVRRATDLLWTLESTDMFRLLVVERGWSRRAYVQHLEHMLATTLLAEPVPRRRASRGPGGG